MTKERNAPFPCPPLARRSTVTRSYCEIVVGLGVRTVEWSPGRVVLLANCIPADAEKLAALSELAMVAAYASARSEAPCAESLELHVGFILLRKQWSAPVEATASAMRCAGTGWLLDCELRTHGPRPIARAFSYAR